MNSWAQYTELARSLEQARDAGRDRAGRVTDYAEQELARLAPRIDESGEALRMLAHRDFGVSLSDPVPTPSAAPTLVDALAASHRCLDELEHAYDRARNLAYHAPYLLNWSARSRALLGYAVFTPAGTLLGILLWPAAGKLALLGPALAYAAAWTALGVILRPPLGSSDVDRRPLIGIAVLAANLLILSMITGLLD